MSLSLLDIKIVFYFNKWNKGFGKVVRSCVKYRIYLLSKFDMGKCQVGGIFTESKF